ncbi:hypothetical protein Scep_001805 [Stephania cephalantha]|uniref:Uncharacterized protein n=1 Tax=Stephania cephalantha TaxID=152367 RepID=A0AAP0Q5E3_9MAGN
MFNRAKILQFLIFDSSILDWQSHHRPIIRLLSKFDGQLMTKSGVHMHTGRAVCR